MRRGSNEILSRVSVWGRIRVSSIRGFSIPEGRIPPIRNIEDAPAAMRQELLDAFYLAAGQTQGQLDVDNHLYLAISQCLGVQAAGNPMGGRRQRLGRDLGNADWPRIYDLVVRLWPEFQRVGFHEVYREAVNRILAAHAIAWDLGPDGRLHRVLPEAAHAQVQAGGHRIICSTICSRLGSGERG